MKQLLITTIAAVLLVGCGESQPPTTDYVDPRVANYDPNESWGLSEEEKAAEEAAKKPQPEPPITKAPYISIHEAVKTGSIEAVKQHLAAGTKVDAKGGGDYTPLHVAAYRGHKELAELLITKGADMNVRNTYGEIPLDLAILDKHTELADLLRKHGGKTKKELEAAGN
ncbi:ankyrin repeat domain-containing protein [bacterium]|nr:ankyrin repeat domain-containing protein [bacterium]